MSEKKCASCGSEMGLGAPSSEKVKIQYECWCGHTEEEFFTEDELNSMRAAAVGETAPQPNSMAA